MKMEFCRRISGARVVRSRYREKYRQKYTLRYRQDCENRWLRELSSQRISSQLSKMPTSWLLGFRLSSLSSRESWSFLCGSGACGASGTLSLVPRSFVLCYSLFALSAQPSQAPGWEGRAPIDLGGREQRDRGSPAPCASREQKTHPGRGGSVL